MISTLWFINATLFLTNLFVFTYKFLIKTFNRLFPPFQDPNFFAKELFSPEPYEIPLYLGLTFIWVIIIFSIKKVLIGGAIERGPASAQNFSSLTLVRALVGMKSRQNLSTLLIFLILLAIFIINVGAYPLKDNIQFIKAPVDPIPSIFILVAYLSLIALIILFARTFKKLNSLIISLILITIAIFTFEPGFPLSTHDGSYFLGPIYEISHGKTIFTSTSSQYGFLSTLFLGFMHQIHIFNPFYLPFLTWLLYIVQYFLSFWIIYKASRSIVFSLLGLFSILTLNYFSLFHLPNTFPQIGPIRWLPMIISLVLLQRYKNITDFKFIFFLSLLSLWNIEAGIALFLTYAFTLFLLTLAGKIELKKLIKSVGLIVFNIFLFLITLNIIHFLLGKPLIDYIAASNRLRDFAVSGIAMIPIPWRTHFWFVLLVYFATIVYFFRKNQIELGGEKGRVPASAQRFFQPVAGREHLREGISRQNLTQLLYSANLSLFAGIYYIGRSHPHNLFHISIFFLLNSFIFLGLIKNKFLRISQNKRLSFIFYILFFIFFIVYPAFNRKQALATMIKTKFDGLKKEKIFMPDLEKRVKKYYFYESKMIKEYIPETEILILSVDDTYLFYLTGKNNLLLDNPQSGIASASKKELNRALKKALKTCPQKIVADCTLFGCPKYQTFNHEAINVQKLILKSLEKSCKVKYKPAKCTNKLCISKI